MCISQSWLEARIAVTQAHIEALEAALQDQIENGGIVSYTLDTGQSRQVTQRMDSKRAEETLDMLYNRLSMLCARMTGGNTMVARPAW